MSKLPESLENPIDNIIYSSIHLLSDPLRKTFPYLTPNDITSISIFFGTLGLYFLYKNNLVLFVLFFSIFYYLDCLDGFYARKYDMVTQFGDIYDHLRDIIIFSLLIILVVSKYYEKISWWIMLLFVVLFILMQLQISCQQTYYIKEDNTMESLDFITLLCFNKEMIYFTRYFGCGTFVLAIILMILFLHYIQV
ncbi:MAG TPA: CDP-alcohol phosphatidyltransferase family protein [Allocoleopsis sp.]